MEFPHYTFVKWENQFFWFKFLLGNIFQLWSAFLNQAHPCGQFGTIFIKIWFFILELHSLKWFSCWVVLISAERYIYIYIYIYLSGQIRFLQNLQNVPQKSLTGCNFGLNTVKHTKVCIFGELSFWIFQIRCQKYLLVINEKVNTIQKKVFFRMDYLFEWM